MAEVSLLIMPSDECHWTSLMISQHWVKLWLGAIRQQAAIGPNVDTVLCLHMTPLGHNELINIALFTLWYMPLSSAELSVVVLLSVKNSSILIWQYVLHIKTMWCFTVHTKLSYLIIWFSTFHYDSLINPYVTWYSKLRILLFSIWQTDALNNCISQVLPLFKTC